MRKQRLKGDERATLDITSTIDVVFLLLIFFISTIRMPKPEADIRAFLPREEPTVTQKGGGGTETKTKDETDIRVDLRSGARGTEVYLDDRHLAGGLRDLGRKLRALDKFRDKAIESKVILAAGRKVPYLYVVRALNLCGVHHFDNVSFALPPKEKGGAP